MKYELIATTTFGLEAVVKREIQQLGYKLVNTEDGKITFLGDDRAIVRSNLWLRCADRVLIKMGEFQANTFEELFQQTKGISWEEIIPPDGKIVVDGVSVKSQLSSVPACQRIVNKAIAEGLLDSYGGDKLPETGALYKVKMSLLKNRATLTLDTTGPGLHKRGYRVATVKAPIKETLAAAMVQLSFYKGNRVLVDPFCGSGTIPIEAAMIAMNLPPGINRKFAYEEWEFMNPALVKEERENGKLAVKDGKSLQIFASDIDRGAIQASQENAEKAGVAEAITFEKMDVEKLTSRDIIDGIIVTNPPYGERIGKSKELGIIYKQLKVFIEENQGWSVFLITSDENVEEEIFQGKVNRRRKLYNGRLQVCYYQHHGEKRKREDQ